jgi:transketolase
MPLKKLSKKIRLTILEVIYNAKTGHIGGSFSCIDILIVLFFQKIIFFDPKKPKLQNRDRFILSKGHACLAYYAALCEIGFIKRDDLKTFEKDDSDLLGHPVRNMELGIEFSNGSLGMGLSLGIGVALSLKKKKKIIMFL